MKISLISKIDLKILDKALEDYNYETSQIPKYIIMNKKTFDDLKTVPGKKYMLDIKDYYGIDGCWYYDSFPIAFCDKLAYGEVEIV